MRSYLYIFLKYLSYLCLSTLLGCTSLQKVYFASPVDTTTKEIDFQEKRTFHLKEVGVFASNDFEGARMNDFKKLNDSTAIVVVNPENTPINQSAYYGFKIWSGTLRPFYIAFQYPEGYKHRYMPKIKEGKVWSVLDSSRMFIKEGLVNIKLNLSKEPLIVAAQEIESSVDVRRWYTNLAKDKDYIEVLSAGSSVLGRDVPVLDIYTGAKKNKKIVVLLTRQHPPEVTGYYAFQSFLETILTANDLSAKFLQNHRILAFPIVNPDGVDMGHWRHNAGGVDTNRDWSVYHQPEIAQVTRFINKESKKYKGKIILGLDFHSTYEDVFYTNKTRETTVLPNFIDHWFAGLERNIPNYTVHEKSSNSTKPVSKGWFLYAHNAVGITYEIGDATPRKFIQLIGRVSATEMMKILVAND